jgi:hypothetical protein
MFYLARNAQLLNSLLKTFNVDLKTNGFVKMDLQKRTQEATLSGLLDNMSPTAIFTSIRLRSLERPPAIVLTEITRAVLNSRMRAKFVLRDIRFMILNLNDPHSLVITL